jgi:hypothetical protein
MYNNKKSKAYLAIMKMLLPKRIDNNYDLEQVIKYNKKYFIVIYKIPRAFRYNQKFRWYEIFNIETKKIEKAYYFGLNKRYALKILKQRIKELEDKNVK